VIRTGAELREGIAGIDEMLAQLGEYRGCYQKHRLYNDLLTAKIALASALDRKESIGCHFREDSAEENQRYRIIIQNSDSGLALSHEAV
jgi:aspartate oxidase